MGVDKKDQIRESMESLLEMDHALALDCINFVFTQLNDQSFIGKINPAEYAMLVRNANRGLSKIVYLKHYSRDLVAKTAFQSAAANLLILLYTRPLNGNDRDLLIEEFKSKQNVTIQKG